MYFSFLPAGGQPWFVSNLFVLCNIPIPPMGVSAGVGVSADFDLTRGSYLEMFKKFFTVLTGSLTFLFAGAPFNVSNSNPIFVFDEIMEMMVGPDISYERLGRYSDIPFNLKNRGDRWVFT